MRARLPDRRPSITEKLTWGDGRYHVTIGIDPKSGAAREVFADGLRQGSELEALIDDACVCLSLLLQHGVPADAVARHLGRQGVDPMAPAASILGEIASTLARVEGEHAAERCAAAAGAIS